jgi:cyclase
MAQGSAPKEWPTGLIEVAENAFAYVQATGGLCVANAGLIVGAEAVVAVDSLFTPSMTRAFQAEIRRVTDRPVDFLVNTHHHVDHSLGNAHFAPAQIVSHARARDEMERVGLPLDLLRQVVPHFCDEIADARVTLPDLTFEGEMTFHLGDRTARLLHFGTAHTLGDALVYLPQSRLLFAGDVAFHYVTPLAFEGHISHWIEVADRVLAMDVDTIVPGHGPIGGKADLRRMRDYLALVRSEARKAFDAGVAAEEAASALGGLLGEFADWGEPERVVLNVGRLYQEFRGEI